MSTVTAIAYGVRFLGSRMSGLDESNSSQLDQLALKIKKIATTVDDALTRYEAKGKSEDQEEAQDGINQMREIVGDFTVTEEVRDSLNLGINNTQSRLDKAVLEQLALKIGIVATVAIAEKAVEDAVKQYEAERTLENKKETQDNINRLRKIVNNPTFTKEMRDWFNHQNIEDMQSRLNRAS